VLNRDGPSDEALTHHRCRDIRRYCECSGQLSNRALVVISQADAALTSTSISDFASSLRETPVAACPHQATTIVYEYRSRELAVSSPIGQALALEDSRKRPLWFEPCPAWHRNAGRQGFVPQARDERQALYRGDDNFSPGAGTLDQAGEVGLGSMDAEGLCRHS